MKALILAAMLFGGTVSAATAATVAENDDYNSYGYLSTSGAYGQSFTALGGGVLDDVTLHFMQIPTPSQQDSTAVKVEMFSTAGGLPDGLLGSVTVSGLSLTTTSQAVVFDFSSFAISLIEGARYAFSIKSLDGGVAIRADLSSRGPRAGDYAGGQALVKPRLGDWREFPNDDFAFKVEATTPVPLPAGLPMLAAGLLVLGWVRRNAGT